MLSRHSPFTIHFSKKMYPELFRIGSFPINTYGVLLALAFLLALFVSARLAQRDGLQREAAVDDR